MAFDWSVIGIKDITSLLLYGTFFPPTDKASETLIRPVSAFPPPIQVNMASFMNSGPGRFALGSRSPLVETFFDTAFDTSWMQPGVRYNKVTFQNMLRARGVSNVNSDFTIKQYLLDDGGSDQDYRLRSYIKGPKRGGTKKGTDLFSRTVYRSANDQCVNHGPT